VYENCHLFVVITVGDVTAGGVQMSHCIQSEGSFLMHTAGLCYMGDTLVLLVMLPV